jgi:hypothetical protein
MEMRRTLLLLATGALVTSGCSALAAAFAESIGMPLESKAVAHKNRAQELIATDGTTCFVSRGKFEAVEIGDLVPCTWSSEPLRDPHGG